jgi:hypothetical protein
MQYSIFNPSIDCNQSVDCSSGTFGRITVGGG